MPHKRAKAVGKLIFFDNKMTLRSIDRFGVNLNMSFDFTLATSIGKGRNSNRKTKSTQKNNYEIIFTSTEGISNFIVSNV